MKIINKNLFISFLTVLIPVILQFFYLRFVSYNIDKILYGKFILIQTFIAALSQIFLQIPSQAFDRFFNENDNKKYYINEFRTMLIFINIISFFFIVLYGLLMKIFSYNILFLIYIYFVFLSNYSFNQKVFLLSLERKKYFYLKLLEANAKFIMPLLFYIYFHNLFSFLFGIVIGYLIAFIVLIIYMREYPFKIKINWKKYKKYFLFAYPVFFMAIFNWGISFIDRYMINFYISTKAVGFYSILAQIAAIGQIIGQIYFIYTEPIIFKLYKQDKEKAFKTIKKYLIILTILFIFLLLLSLIVPREIYTIILEPSIVYNDYYFYTMILLLMSIFLLIFHTAHHMYFKLLKKLSILAVIYFFALIINIVINMFFLKKFGIIIGAISTLISYLFILLVQIVYIFLFLKKLKLKVFDEV